MNAKLLIVVNDDSFFMSHRLPIAVAALRKGFAVHIAAPFTMYKEKIIELGFKAHPLKIDRKSYGIISNFQIFLQLLRLFNSIKPDIVHLVTIKPVIIGGIVARLSKVPSVVAAISGLGHIFIERGKIAVLRQWIIGIFYKFSLRHINIKVIFQNEEDRSLIIKLSKIRKKNTILIPGSGVDLNLFQPTPAPKGKKIVLLAARMLVEKGVTEFVEAANIINHKKNVARFVLVGNPDPGNPSSIPINQIEEWQEKGVVEWWGSSQDMPKIFSQCNIVVLPSYREGLPKVLSEAAACGRPVITTDVPGCKDAILNKSTGLLVPSKNSKELANAIKLLIENSILCEDMGKKARHFAERNFDIKDICSAHLQTYEALIRAS